ncbi:MAG TPA: HAD family hydrolase [Gammaproteobacteria bacterium]|nr:HAD family hydrolase [Gammaproteobacteria bacterium]
MYKLLVFDWDGTLMDSQQEIVSCFQAAARDVNLTVPSVEQVRNVIGLGMFEAVHAIYPSLDTREAQQAFVERYRVYYFSSEKAPSRLFDGVADMLHALVEQGYFVSVATGKGRRGLNDVLQRTKLDRLFHYTRCVDEAHSKPHPQMLLDTMDYLGIQAHEALMIGDTEYDLQMAANAAVDGVAVSCGAHDKNRLIKHNPRVCLAQTRDLEAWLSGIA